MVSAVRSRPNHYETLGLAPTASDEEIARAFAREIGLFGPRAVAGVTELSIAFETLRDPAKRRAYDEALGLRREPRPAPAPMALRFGVHFDAVPAGPPGPPVRDTAPPPLAAPSPPLPPEPAAEPRTAPFIAASLRRAPEPDRAEPPEPAEPEAWRRPNPWTRGQRLYAAGELHLEDAEDRPAEWARPAMIGGGLVAAVILLGAFAGWEAGNDEPQQVAAGVSSALSVPKATAEPAAPPAAEESDWASQQPRRRPRTRVASRARRSAPPPNVADQSFAQAVQGADSQPSAPGSAPATVDSPAAQSGATVPPW